MLVGARGMGVGDERKLHHGGQAQAEDEEPCRNGQKRGLCRPSETSGAVRKSRGLWETEFLVTGGRRRRQKLPL